MDVESQLTTVRTAPGFCPLRAFTTWNTSTTPSVLHRSMMVDMAQNMPQRLTMSLQGRHLHTHALLLLMTWPQLAYVPAVYHNGPVAGFHLDSSHVLIHISHSTQVRAVTIRTPVGDVELDNLMGTARLWGAHTLSCSVSSHHMWCPTHL